MALPVPVELEEALAATPAARARFDALPPEGKDAWIRWITRPRVPGARRRRVGRAVAVLGGSTTRVTQTEEAQAPPPLPPRERWPWALVALLLVVAGLLVWAFAFRNDDSNETAVQKSAVPNVVGRPRVKAEDLVRRAGMRPFSTPYRSPRRRGLVVNQRPKPGTVLADGSVVTLLVSAGPPRAAVPDVVGLAAADASARLARAGFRAKEARVDSVKQPGTVLKQRPAAKIRAAPGSVVLLTVAKRAAATTRSATTVTTVTTAPRTTTTRTAPPATTQPTQPAAGTVAVPALTGKGLGTALTSLEQLGLLAGVKYVSAQAPVGRVQAQNPPAGAKVRPGTRVQLNLSEGPNPGNPTDVPDVNGEDEATARSDLQAAGFRVVVIRRARGPGESGSVVEQLPSAGSTLSSDDFVAIYVRD